MYYSTPYINIEKFNLPGHSMPCVVYDLSGAGRYRENWSFFYPDVDGILFVVDCADKDRLPIVVEVLEEMARHPGLADRKIPFLICANKQDHPDAIDDNTLRKFIQLDKLKSMNEMKYDVKPVRAL